ncbi:MAG TPA: hypothetical protein VN851_03270 [Thermoanaerobaculia bacterium]|nr:hypothetical protein [Thermoanaerobaculia bacterium]
MTQRAKARRISIYVMLVGASCILPSYGFAADPRAPTVGPPLMTPIDRREADLAQRRREDVVPEVSKRIAEMGIAASAGELTDLLGRWERQTLALDKCRIGGSEKAADCRTLAAELAWIDAAFRDRSGLSVREFQSGRKATPGRDAARAARIGGRNLTANSGQSCTCAFTVYSADRWMNRYWALECNNHGSHGFCSNNVDSAHSAGIGAMTGDIDLYFGGNHVHRSCPDDHATCFRGPSNGEWGNVCNCDTWHSQTYNPYTSWYGGDLTDASQVTQATAGWWTVPGPCSANYLVVKEYVQENDPWCCDDPMGDLWASLPLADGYGFTSAPASTQNCNGGSQSGVYPNCGTFGATIQAAYNCTTTGSPPTPCDPNQEQACWESGGTWNSNGCYCMTPCLPDKFCPEERWDYETCTCREIILQ